MKALKKMTFVALAFLCTFDCLAFNYAFNNNYSEATLSFEPLRKIEYGEFKEIKEPSKNYNNLHIGEEKSKNVPGAQQEILLPSEVMMQSLKESIADQYPAQSTLILDGSEDQPKEGSFMDSVVSIFSDYGIFGGIIAILLIFTGLRYSMGGRF